MEKSFTGYAPDLGVRLFAFYNQIECVNRIRFSATENLSGAMSSPSSDKYPNITLIVNGKAGVVVWIVYTTLVSDNRRFRYSMFFVIIVGNHGTQIPIIRTSIAPINEESLVHFGCINGHGSDRMRPGKGQRP